MIYENVKKYCAEKGYSIAGIEKAANLSNGTIGKWRESVPKADSLVKVSKVLGISIDALLKD